MLAAEEHESSGLPPDLVELDPSMSLYYNTRTHKCQYHYRVERHDDRISDNEYPGPSCFRNVFTEEAIQGVSSHGDTEKHDPRKDSGISHSDQTEVYSMTSGNALSVSGSNEGSPSILQSTTIRSAPPRPLLPNPISTIELEVFTKSDIASLAICFLHTSNRAKTFSSLRRLVINHWTIDCADAEDLAEARPATTIFNLHGDNSASVFCAFMLSKKSGCVCRVSRAFEPLLGTSKATAQVDQHMEARRKMWRKLSLDASEVCSLTERVSELLLDGAAQNPLLTLLGRFVVLCQPQLGYDPEDTSTAYGVETYERRVCREQSGSKLIDACDSEQFHFDGEIEGMTVDVSGLGRWCSTRHCQ